MATWTDIERALDNLEELDKATLESFARVMPPASQNPNFNRRFDHAQQRIRRRLDELAAAGSHPLRTHVDERWYKKPAGIIVLSVTAGLLLLLIKFLIGI